MKQLLHRIDRPREEQGQMLAMLAVSIVALIAAGAFVMDVGSWFQSHRATQSVADASALAAVSASQFYPDSDSRVGPRRAQQFALLNRAAGQPGSVATADIVPAWYSQSAGTTTATSAASGATFSPRSSQAGIGTGRAGIRNSPRVTSVTTPRPRITASA